MGRLGWLALVLVACPAAEDKDTPDTGATASADTGDDSAVDSVPPPDSDGDGWADADDCAPDDPAVNPSAVETCNDIDDDCDGSADEDDAIGAATWHPDADGDGYGDAASSTASCEAPEGYLADASDCDDAEPGVNPAATESCNNGLDDDCDGQAAECRLSGELLLDDVAATIASEHVEYYPALAGGCDVSRDGADDLLVGLPVTQVGEYEWDGPGALYVIAGGLPAPGTLSDAWAMLAATADLYAGHGVACAGDGDGDGAGDLVLSASDGPDADGSMRGAVYLFGRVEAGTQGLDAAVAVVEGISGVTTIGYQVGGATDLSGDGAPDISFLEKERGDEGIEATRVRVFAGPVSGSLVGDDATATIEFDGMPQLYHYSAGGDLDGDGVADVAVGAYTDATVGAVYLFSGPFAGLRSRDDRDAEIDSEGDESRASGTSHVVGAAGDVDADGLDDLLVGFSFGGSAGEAFIVTAPLGGIEHLLDAAARFTGDDPDGGLGGCVASAGDADADGWADILVSDAAHTTTGAAYLLHGPFSGEISRATHGALLVGDGVQHDLVGTACTGAGDMDGDGNDDVAIAAQGSWDYSINETQNPGAVYLVSGGGF